MKKLTLLVNLLIDYHLQIMIFLLFIFILIIKNNRTKIYYIDTDFIKYQFTLNLTNKTNLNQAKIKLELQEFDKIALQTASLFAKNAVVVKKANIIAGGVDITYPVCNILAMSNCESYLKQDE
jgi:hypothetical protein